MKAVLCREHGPPDRLAVGEVEPQPLGPGEVRIRVRAAGVNFPDTLIIQGLYQVRPPLPFVPGFEVAGEIVEVGDGVDSTRRGERVMALTSAGYGAFAEHAVARACETVPIPEGLDDATATAFYTAYGTAYHALVQRGRLVSGESLIVLGASGGVGLAAVDVGTALGARVIAVGRSAEKLALATTKGASETVAYVEGTLTQTIRELTGGKGADLCLDTLGGNAFDEMSRAMGWDGRLLTVGFTSGVVPKLPVNLPLLKGYALIGVYWGAFAGRDPETNAENFRSLAAMLSGGRISPHLAARYPMDRAGEALADLLGRRTAGKLVLDGFPDEA